MGMKIDFGGVEQEIRKGGGRAAHVPPGAYRVKVVTSEVRHKGGDETASKYIQWSLQIVNGPHKGGKLRFITSLKPDALWNLRNFIHACIGKNVAGKALNFEPSSLYGKQLGVMVEDNEYEDKEGKKRVGSQVADTMTLADLAELGDEDSDDSDDEDSDDEEDGDDLDDMDRDGLKALMVSVVGRKAKKAESDDDLRSAIRDARGSKDGADDEEDDDLDEVDLDSI